MILLYHSLLEVLLTQTQTKIFGNFCFRFCYFFVYVQSLKIWPEMNLLVYTDNSDYYECNRKPSSWYWSTVARLIDDILFSTHLDKKAQRCVSVYPPCTYV